MTPRRPDSVATTSWRAATKAGTSAPVVGATVLAVVAYVDHDWGFLLLEGVWAIVSAISLAQVLASRRTA